MASKFLSRQPVPGTETNMDVDYVIVFQFDQARQGEALNAYESLISALASVGLTSEVRAGDEDSLLIFTRIASKDVLLEEVRRSRTRDWLYGVRLAEPQQEIEKSLDDDPLYPAERLRIIYQLITTPRDEGGAGITPKKGDWMNVESIFSLHDHKFNREWLKSWASSYTLKPQDLDQIRNTMGEKVAFYFAFTQSYFTALIGMASFGTAAWILLGNFSAIYGVVNTLLCVTFVEYWKFQQKELAVRWGVKGVSAIEMKRHDFVAEREVRDPVTGAMMQMFPASKRFQRQLLQIPFALAAALALGSVIAICFGIEIFISEIYDGPFKSVLIFIPTGIITTVQPFVMSALTKTAERLTKYENYATTIEYETAYTQKLFVLNFITSYLPIILTAFIYVPFASNIVPYLDIFQLTVRPFAENEKQIRAPTSGFHINPERLKNQVIYFAVTNQVVKQVLEIIVPYIKQKGKSTYKELKSNRAAKRGISTVAENDAPEEQAFLDRVRKEAELDIYDVTGDFREMVMQYGYLALFSIIWPVTSLSFLISNWIELRTDAVKICIESRRPTPSRADGIGPWLDTLELINWVGSITTAALAYLFSNGGVGPDGSPRNLQLWLLLLTVFVSEHAYLVVRIGVRIFVSRLDSPGHQKERAERFALRKRYLEESMGRQATRLNRSRRDEEINRTTLEEEARRSTLGHERVEDRFWKRQHGWQETTKVGISLIEKALLAENRKQR